MEGLLHPVGPEEARVYWFRRGAALFLVVILLGAVGFVVDLVGGAEPSVTAEPASLDTMHPVSPTATVSPVSAPAGPSDQVRDQEAVPAPSGAETKTRPKEEPGEQAPPAGAMGGEISAPAQAIPSATPTPAKEVSLPPEPANTFHRTEVSAREEHGRATCDPQAVRLSIDGPDRVHKGEPAMYRIGVTNTSSRECSVTIDERAFELKVYSGADRIWSSLDCLTGTPPREATLPPGGNMDWEMEWRAERSAPDCRANGQPMGSGTYVATAQIQGIKPVRLVMQLQS